MRRIVVTAFVACSMSTVPSVTDADAAADKPEPTRVVVALDAPVSEPEQIEAAQDAALAALPEGSVEAVQTFENVPGLVLTVTDPAAIAVLEDSGQVTRIDESSGGRGTLAEVRTIIGADRSNTAGFTGEGYTVAVIDSGVDSDHPELAGDLLLDDAQCFGASGGVPGVGFCPDGTDRQTGVGSAEDDHGHGTNVAGVITGSGTLGAPGVAPDAMILPIKVLDGANGFGDFGQIIAALDYVLSNPDLGVDVVNLSLTTSAQFVGTCDTATAWTALGAAAVNALRADGVLTFAAAGNNGSATTMGAPACLSNVIAVTATDDADDLASFSQTNAATDLAAPGVGVVSADVGGGLASWSGTSESSPVAAACAVLVMDAGVATTPATIETRLETSDVSVTDPGSGRSFPRLDCDLAPPDPPGPVPGVVLTGGSSPVVSWTTPSDEIDGFDLLRARNDTGVWDDWTFEALTASSTSFTDVEPADGLYAYLVRGYNAGGAGPWTLAGTTLVNRATTVPSVPTLAGAPMSGPTVSWTWGDVADETRYTLQRARYLPSLGMYGEWAFTLHGRNTTGATLTGVPDGIYAYVLTADNALGSSAASIQTVTVSAATLAPDAPSALTATHAGSGVQVIWTDEASGADQELYVEVQRARLDGSSWTDFTPFVADRDITSFADATVTAGTYAYLVRAVNPHGASAWTVTTITIT